VSDKPFEHVVWGALTEFQIELAGGQLVTIWAHSYHVEDRNYVFSILMRGSPGYEVDVASIPAAAVSQDAGLRPIEPNQTSDAGDIQATLSEG